MGQNSAIEWTEATWNPLTGCDKISPGCTNCYAERMSLRLRLMGQKNYANGFEQPTIYRVFTQPLGSSALPVLSHCVDNQETNG